MKIIKLLENDGSNPGADDAPPPPILVAICQAYPKKTIALLHEFQTDELMEYDTNELVNIIINVWSGATSYPAWNTCSPQQLAQELMDVRYQHVEEDELVEYLTSDFKISAAKIKQLLAGLKQG